MPLGKYLDRHPRGAECELHGGIAGIGNFQVVGGRLAPEALRFWVEMRQRGRVGVRGHRDLACLEQILKHLERQFGEMALCGA